MKRLTKKYFNDNEVEPYVYAGVEYFGDSYGGEVIDRLAEYEDTELTPQNIICREDDIKLLQQQNKEFREEILKLRNQRQLDITELQDLSFALIDMHDECVKWEREAIKSKAQLGEIRILVEKQ